MPKLSYEIDGNRWLPISRAAKLLGTNALGVRKLMSEGKLDWRQSRANSMTLVVEEKGVLALRLERPPKLRPSPDPLARVRKPEPIRSGGGIFTEHHLRMTLPVNDETAKRKKPD
jgi:hypothetical protein